MSNIPKIIHYCWVGGNPKPQSVIYCIESWKKCCPDYEIREWNETNYDFTKNRYMNQAYKSKKWGFVPDYARLDIVYEYGGIYLDTDVEMIHNFDELLENECFFGFENTGDGEFFVNCGHGFGAVPKHAVIKAARDFYENISFIKEDGTLNLLASPYYTTQSLCQIGLVQENRDQVLTGVHIYASDMLCPKNFRTGKVKKTKRTVSVHHFTASWVDEKIKAELVHQQMVKKYFGSRMGGYILIAESVFEKYDAKEMVTTLPLRVVKKFKHKIITMKDAIPYYIGLLKAKVARARFSSDKIVLLDTSIDSYNSGDCIIMENCMRHLSDCMSIVELDRIPTHRTLSDGEKRILKDTSRKILCGTNILSGFMRTYGVWRIETDVSPYCGTILMGIGFDSSDLSYDRYTKNLFHTILSRKYVHSVRDSFSEKKLKKMGINNVINTGCPTMWNLTPEYCATIPAEKASKVICTITDYHRDKKNDSAMLEILLANYEEVYLWLQGAEDLLYIQELGFENRLILVDSTLDAFDKILEIKNLDYVGTRLHAGIRAISKGHRSLIISIDNRAECISADTGLPILKREDTIWALQNRIRESFETKINLPWEKINMWKNQFKE